MSSEENPMRQETPDGSTHNQMQGDSASGDSAQAEIERTARDLSARLALQSDDLDADDFFEDDEAALRWRRALLRLSETFLDAAEERRDLSPILLGALHNALEQLLIHGEEDDLMALEDWLSHEAPFTDEAGSTPDESGGGDFLMAGEHGAFNGQEQRAGADRRSPSERRRAERRAQNHLSSSPTAE